MENLHIILSIASAALGLLITTLTFIIKFVKAVKAKNKAEVANLLMQGVTTAVQFVEQVKSKAQGSLDGATKKSMAMSEVKAFCADHKIKFDEETVDALIEEVVELTKKVNVKASSSNQKIAGKTVK